MPAETALLAVLIDADNVPAKFASAIIDEITAHGEAGLRRVYGDWSNPHLSGWTEAARNLGLVPHHQAANTKGKNASDIGLVIDAMDILHAGHFDGFVLVSSDSDFTRLASRIREQGLTVIGIGEEKTPESFQQACNRFVTIENIATSVQPAPNGKPSTTMTKPAAQQARQLLINAMTKIDPEGEWYHLGQLGQQLQKDRPQFDTRTYGCGKLSTLIERLDGFEIKFVAGSQPQVRRAP
ncbi:MULTISPECIES: NYN domain-containing protein [unclassified Roseovarius]|uniref:NYN domain-containing protein n=1 Tax=unclassified Roseovarius TaxID=2614913 RepID=UPI00273E27E1|nr:MULTISPECIES: NYN domain-containing protein [unclassified Roseovarius]